MSRSGKFWSFMEGCFANLGQLFLLIVIFGFIGSFVGLVHYVVFWSIVGLIWAYLFGDMTLLTNIQNDGHGIFFVTTISGAVAILVAFFVDSHLQFDKNDDHHEIKAFFVFVGTLSALSVAWRIFEFWFFLTI